ncbi:HTH-type transcriptional regulator ImmR [Clostridium tertium]|uniref:HTH-type transcriptional regulator ImmR n=1 Tax=Clostridium tertium TaxID=1559 RepID=A0A6N3CVQ8_9CLOT
MMEVGKKIKNARVKSSLTQEQVAGKIMVSRQTLSNWENGKSLPDILSVIKLSDLYQISLDELLKGDQKMIEKIEKDTSIVKSNRKLMIIGYVALALAMILTAIDISTTNPIFDFIGAASPWVLLGVGVACICTYISNKKEN